MAMIINSKFRHEDVHVDGNDYIDCLFEHCNIMYSGGDLPIFERCSFEHNAFSVERAAQRTVKFLKWLHKESGGGQSLALQMLEIDNNRAEGNGAPTGRGPQL